MATEKPEDVEGSGADFRGRLEALSARRRQLAESRPTHQGSTDDLAATLAKAQQRAREAAKQTARAYERAAQAHDRAAAVLERLVRDGVGDQEQHRASGQRHRELAELDRGRAADEWARLDREKASTGSSADTPSDPESRSDDQPS